MSHEMDEPIKEDPDLDRLLVKSLVDYAIFIVSPAGAVIRWQPGAENLFGYSEREVLGRYFSFVFTPDDIELGQPASELASALAGVTSGHDRWHVRKDGTRFWGINTVQPLRDESGAVIGFSKIVRDLTGPHLASLALRASERKMRHLVEEVQYLSLHDSLTGLANRQFFLQTANTDPSRRHRDRVFAVLFLDLDHFKSVNDTLGHAHADLLLVAVARRLEVCLRQVDLLARLGGDEFAVLLPDIEGAADAVAIAERILAALARPFSIEGSLVSATASIGIVVVDRSTQDVSIERVLEDADIAMYEAKARGRSQYVVFEESARANSKAALALAADLREAVERNEIRVVYQPIVATATRRITGFEALMRWQHPVLGFLPPHAFLAKAEENGAIVAVDHWVLVEAARQLESWQREFDTEASLTMSVNFSAIEFERPELQSELRDVLAGVELRPHSLAIEVAETHAMDTSARLVATLADIRRLGLNIAIDDFGTGRSALTYLSRLPIDALKIDGSFVASMASNAKSLEVVRAVVTLAQRLGLECIAEGVETEAQLEELTALGCTTAQGFLFSQPLDADAAELLLMPSVRLVN